MNKGLKFSKNLEEAQVKLKCKECSHFCIDHDQFMYSKWHTITITRVSVRRD